MQTDRSLVSTEADSIHITIGKWLTSDGNWVHFNGGSDGITPDIVVEPTPFELAYKLFLFDGETLEYDQVDSRISNMQLILNIMGYDVREDGYFDMATKTAVMEIQTNNSLTSNGVVDNNLLDILNTALDTYQDSYDNDTQLQAAIDYLLGNE
jgi:carboxyl-terminal processing protease